MFDIFLERDEDIGLRGLAFHEFTNASHFTNVEIDWYNHFHF